MIIRRVCEIIIVIVVVIAFKRSYLNRMRPSVAVEESLSVLGNNIKVARLKRRLPQTELAERCGISLSTLVKIENGNCGVAIGAVASVLLALDLGTPFSEIAKSDPLSVTLEQELLPKRIRRSTKGV